MVSMVVRRNPEETACALTSMAKKYVGGMGGLTMYSCDA
jgi:hypothetical protein